MGDTWKTLLYIKSHSWEEQWVEGFSVTAVFDYVMLFLTPFCFQL